MIQGTTEKGAFCETCGLNSVDCVGHYAYIKLCVPVFHIGYFKHTIGILQCICKTCARVLLEEPDRRTYLKRFRRPNLENIQRQALCKAVNGLARKTVYCPYCSSTNGIVKKAGALKIIHDKFRAKKTAEEMERFKATFAAAVEAQKELGIYVNKAVHEDLNPLKVVNLFKRISDEDCELLGLRPQYGRPEEYIWQYISVPPVCIRPSVAQDGASNEDDLTVKLTEIVFSNALIKQGLAKGAPTAQFMVGTGCFSGCSFQLILWCTGTMGVPAALRCDVHQLRAPWRSFANGPKAHSWFLSALEGKTRSFPR